ncbi:MAG: NAD(P)/FAD-dependent oxidoreductase [Acidobacteria bacterium]|nr:MAG: NAD(P)/FAD-dependent oxidoreductase [Acidobacteriota bacterium]
MSSHSHDSVCVIGAGSSGIVAVKCLAELGLPVTCYELGSGIGGNWRYGNDNGMSSAYRSLHINTSKTRMAFSDFPMPEDYPDYPHHSQILRYFEAYADRFDLRRHIRFRTAVERLEPAGDGSWWVTLEGGERRRHRAVLVANGHHWCPRRPTAPGDFAGLAMHSHDYRTPDVLVDKRVLVVGIGNSGVDIACESARHAAATFLSTRRSAHILPKYAFGRPIDTFTTPLSSRLPLALQRRIFELILKLSRGPQTTFGVPRPQHHLLQAHPTVSAELLNLVGHGRIAIKPDVERLCGERVRFADGSEEAIDVIVWAIGYRIRFPFLDRRILDPEGNAVRLYLHVVPPAHPGLYFIGLIQPLGAVMPLAEEQSRWVAELLAGRCALPERAAMERRIDADLEAMRRRYVHSERHTIQVDFFPYRHALRSERRRGRRRAQRRRPAAPAPVPSPEEATRAAG